jgi:hypothetical protein
VIRGELARVVGGAVVNDDNLSVSSPASWVKRPMSSSVAAKTAAAFLAGMITERTEGGSGSGHETLLHVAGERNGTG